MRNKKWTMLFCFCVAVILLSIMLCPGCTQKEKEPTGEINFATESFGTEVFDPTLDSGNTKFYQTILYDYLVGANPDGTLSKDDGIARDWTIEHTANCSIYTFYIRKGVKFHNGDDLTAEDVKFSIEYLMRPETLNSRANTFRTYVDTIEVTDPYTVVIRTKKPYGVLHYDLSPTSFIEGIVLPKKYIEEVGSEYFNTHPIGSGFYRLKEHVPAVSMTFEAVKDHWRVGTPKYKTLSFILAPEMTTQVAMLKTGQVDATQLSHEMKEDVQKAGFSTFTKEGGAIVYIMLLNTFEKGTYLADERVREALNLAVDRETIIREIFKGAGQNVWCGRYGSLALGYEPQPIYPYDPERARALLNEAFPGGVTLDMAVFPIGGTGVPELTLVMQSVANMWERVGVKVNQIPMDFGTWMQIWQKGAPNTVGPAAWSNRTLWQSGWRSCLHSTGSLCKVKDPTMDALIEASEEELDTTKMGEKMAAVARYVREHHYYVSICEVGCDFAANPKKISSWDLGVLLYDWNISGLVRQK